MGVRGFPDWSESKQSVTSGFAGNIDELVVRIGGVGNVFKTGNLWYLFDFENGGVNLSFSSSGSGNTSEVISNNSETGQKCWLGSLSSSASGSVNIIKNLIIFSDLPIGVGFSLSSDMLFSYLQFKVEYFINNTQFFSAIRYKPSNKMWYYLNQIGTEFTIGEYSLQNDPSYKLWNYIKLTINPQQSKFSRLFVNDHIFDLSSITIPNNPATINNRLLEFVFNGVNTSPIVSNVYLDNLYFTYNEPM
ncbi:MAG: hypothetical protein AELANPGJ_03596 [Anaerolineae bacterium]|nr:hypothetical protein [Anaerolineae bacterium]